MSDDTNVIAVRDYLESERGCSGNTVEAYVNDIEQFQKFADGRPFHPTLVEQWLLCLSANNIKPSTLARKRMAIMTLARVVARSQKIDETFLRMIDPVRQTRKNLPILTVQQLEKLSEGITGECSTRNLAIIRLMYETAIRASECVSLLVTDIDDQRDYFRVMAKGRRERVVPIGVDCRKTVLDYVRRWRTRYARTSPALFISQDGNPITRCAVSHMLDYHTNRLGLPRSTSHTLRRSRATALMNSGIPIENVQRHLGHSSITATQRYLWLSTDRLKDVHRKYHPSNSEASK